MSTYFEREAFVCQPSYLDAIEKLPQELQGQAALAIMKYGINGEWDNSNPIVEVILTLVQPTINAAKDRYAVSVENGKKGGAPRKVDRKLVKQLIADGKSDADISLACNCTEDYIRKLRKEFGNRDKQPEFSEVTDDAEKPDDIEVVDEQNNQNNLNNNISINNSISNPILQHSETNDKKSIALSAPPAGDNVNEGESIDKDIIKYAIEMFRKNARWVNEKDIEKTITAMLKIGYSAGFIEFSIAYLADKYSENFTLDRLREIANTEGIQHHYLKQTGKQATA